MKNLLAKFKGGNFKSMVLEHGEKIGLGFAGLLVLIFLGMTNWSGYAGTPDEMKGKAEDVERQLAANSWPATKLQEFGIKAAEGELGNVLGSLEVARFDYRVPPSPKLYSRQLPAEEPKLVTVEGLNAVRGNIAMAVYPPEPEHPAEGEVAATTGRPATGRAAAATSALAATGGMATSAMPGPGMGRGRSAAMGGMPTSGMGSSAMDGMDMAMMGAMSGYASAGLATRGVRFVCITGSVDVRKQLENIHKALHLEMVSQAAEYLEYVSFKIQRQRAVRGDDPWVGEWKDLDIQNSLNVLTNEAAEWDLDIVAGDYINEVFTSPLPQRLNGYWTAELVGNPDVPTLTEEEAIQEAALLSAAAVGGVEEEGEVKKKGGFAGAQVNAGKLRRDAMSAAGSTDMMDRYNRFMGAAMGDPMMMGGGGGRRGSGGSADMPMGMGSAMGSAMGMGEMGTMATFADVQLFRFFDFEVEPGECYRYRVQLEITNPNLNALRVVQPEIAQGETRTTPWSFPSPPVAIERDAEFFLSKGPSRRKADQVTISMYQWNPDVGTTANANLTPRFGQLVGGTAKTKLFEIAIPSEEEKDVKFLTKEILLDGASSPIAYEQRGLHADLKLSAKEWGDLVNQGKMDTAVVVNRFGEFERIDPGLGSKQLKDAKDRLEKEREPYREMLQAATMATDAAATDGLTAFAGAEDPMATRGKKKKGGRISNPLKSLSGGMGMGMPGGMMDPMGGMMPGTKGKKKSPQPRGSGA